MPPPPPLLLTKRVTSFLRANLSPHIHAAMLTTPAGSLLAHASNLPAHALRRQCAVAASLWALQGPASDSDELGATPAGSTTKKKRGKHSPPVVTVQLDTGAVFVIRRLRCGMLFICIGGTEGSAGRRTPTPSDYQPLSPTSVAPPTTAAAQPPQDHPADTTDTSTFSSSTLPTSSSSPPSTPSPRTAASKPSSTHTQTPPQPTLTTPRPLHPHAYGSPSESASINSAYTTGAATTTSMASSSTYPSASGMRRQVEDLARWLDERLGGLYVPEEGIGIAAGSGGGGMGVEVR